ncbi:GNAT family N-acetyltransferase [Paenibacillus qinlingensis]|uniref:Acetyltransferase n=1 Tax=Paenibacillus qinlingensis TaxID=1837343 RepID=A0ABU1NY22_9BACL|nr:GNAT family N-acetyltransferase [Paenibacillus qinlingensis]MDR6551722.1 putative acetyltransferase [Paenibacillus qinlingensis]
MIRKLVATDMEQCLALTEFAFKLQFTPEQRADRLAQMSIQESLGFFDEEQLAAKLTLLPLEIIIHNRSYAMCGVASVATWPEYRRQGMVGNLMNQSLRLMRERGTTVSVLNPFSFRFYDKYGWSHFCEIKRYRFQAHLAPRIGEVKGKVRRGSSHNLAELQSIYDTFARNFNGMLQRDEAWWHSSIFRKRLGHLAIYYDEAGTPKGYVLYTIKERLFDLHELVYVDDQSRNGLWRFIANHAPMVDEFTFIAPTDDRFSFVLEEPAIRTEINACYMIRIVDVAAFLQQYPFLATGHSHQFRLHIQDEHATWNTGLFEVTVNGEGEASVIQMPEGTPSDYALTCSIQTLSSMMIGYILPVDLHKMGRLVGESMDIDTLHKVIPHKVPFFMDMF